MSKISVIIPTLQKGLKVLYKLLNILRSDDAVSEILIINNALKDFPFKIHSEKIKIYTPSENLYVNESWNKGVELIENEKFLIINDDILCCERFCSIILNTKVLDMETTGLVGLNHSSITQFDRESVTDISVPVLEKGAKILYSPLPSHMRTGDWGSAFFGKKENYYPIPTEDFKIIYGDNYLLLKNIENGKTNLQISGLPFHHIHSLSSADAEFSSVVVSDIGNEKRYF